MSAARYEVDREATTERPRALDTRQDLAFSWAVTLLGLLARLFVAIAWSKEPVWDGHYYHYGAERIAAGLGYSEDALSHGVPIWKPWTHYPVGYSGLLALFYRLFGSGLLVAPLVNAVAGAVLVLLVHRLARYCLTENRARIAAAIAALHPGLIIYSALVMTEIVAADLLLAALLVALRFRGSFRGPVLAGLLLGLGALVRPVSLLALPLLFVLDGGPWRLALLRTASAVGVALLVIAPWTIRNCARMDGCALISTNGGWNLAIGAIGESGRFETLRASDGCPVVTGQVQQDRCWAMVGWQRIKSNPAKWLLLAPKKLEQTYNHESFAIEYLREADPVTWNEQRRVAGRELLTFFHRLLLVASALGAVNLLGHFKPPPIDGLLQLALLLAVALYSAYAAAHDAHPFYVLPALVPLLALLPLPGRPQQSRALYVLWLLVALTSLTHIVFFGEDRYHLVITPVLCILAAAALRHGRSEPAVAL
ncbi:MAG TPA: glycosyltransferase family 39 protein [Polyangiaceae bacterium]|nr:glycosyltransferase family 39 protein [Polyangiaceae bacterium]